MKHLKWGEVSHRIVCEYGDGVGGRMFDIFPTVCDWWIHEIKEIETESKKSLLYLSLTSSNIFKHGRTFSMLYSDMKSIQHIVSYKFVISPKSRGLDRDIVCRDGTLRNSYHIRYERTYLYLLSFFVDVSLSHVS